MPEFVKVAKVSELPDPGKRIVDMEERLVVLLHVQGQFYCIDDVCTHDGGPLGEGQLCGYELACPRHGAKFDIRSGKVLTMPATENTIAHEVKVVGEDVYVRLNEACS
jgi:3-phenylpropionate/trans-cinnamate dioxygenase ferredoxin component